VRALGVSNFNASLLDAFVARVAVRPIVNQCGLSVAGHRSERWGSSIETVRQGRALGVAYAAYSPLGRVTRVSGVLGLPTVRAIAARHNASSAQVALRWLVQQDVAIVTATRSAAHMVEALASARGPVLAHAEMAALEAIPDACEARVGNNRCA
jgi:2,5-diketo-D-gluconate reductase B